MYIFLVILYVSNAIITQFTWVTFFISRIFPVVFVCSVLSYARGLVVNSSVDMVELAKIMEMVLDVVKRHSSHSSEVFWRDVGDLGAMLFGER